MSWAVRNYEFDYVRCLAFVTFRDGSIYIYLFPPDDRNIGMY